MPWKQINHSGNWWFACFCKRVNIGKENFDIVTLPFFWSEALFIDVQKKPFLFVELKLPLSEVEKKALAYRSMFLGILLECTVMQKHHMNKTNLSFSGFYMNHFYFWSWKIHFFTWLNSKHKLPSLQLLSDSFSKELDKHIFFTIESACFLCS